MKVFIVIYKAREDQTIQFTKHFTICHGGEPNLFIIDSVEQFGKFKEVCRGKARLIVYCPRKDVRSEADGGRVSMRVIHYIPDDFSSIMTQMRAFGEITHDPIPTDFKLVPVYLST